MTVKSVKAPGASPYFDAALRAVHDAVFAVDTEGLVVEFSAAAERLIGWTRVEALGQPQHTVVRLQTMDGAATSGPLAGVLAGDAARGASEEAILLARDGRKLVVRIAAAPIIEDGVVSGAVCAISDYTDQTLLAEELSYRASHDPVTGLLNREEFERRLKHAAQDHCSDGNQHLLCYLDLDQFKIVNDTLGHAAGDELLRQLAALFRARLRLTDVLARIGGDEFGILLHDSDEARGRQVVEDLLACARGFRFVWNEVSNTVTVSIGVAALSGDGDVAKALSQVDAACFAAKDAGRDRARFAADNDEVERRHTEMGMIGRITAALDNDRFILYSEDVVSVRRPDQVVYRELLVRLRGDDGRLIPPSQFIPPAERYFLMGPLDRWVICAALKRLAQLPEDGVTHAVNLSAQSLGDENMLPFIKAQIGQSGVKPSRLCIEITETAAVSQLTDAVHFIRELSAIGVRFALDDFGAGMASFSYLKNLPVNFLKIDGSFVRTMLASRVDRGMVEAINRIGHQMNLRTIAEHVEDEALLKTLAGIGVDYAQGWAIGVGKPF